jgi:large subunit ribosomal protein L20
MPRVKRGFKARRRRKKIMKAAKGFVGGRRRQFRAAVATVRRAWRYATRDRRMKKRDFRRLWIARINAAARQCGTSYSRLMGLMKSANVEVDRKILAHLAVHDFKGFAQVVDAIKPS